MKKLPTSTHRYPLKYILQWIVVVLFCIFFLWAIIDVSMAEQPMSHNIQTASDHKFDGGCTGSETMGRCADKCLHPDGYATLCSELPPVQKPVDDGDNLGK